MPSADPRRGDALDPHRLAARIRRHVVGNERGKDGRIRFVYAEEREPAAEMAPPAPQTSELVAAADERRLYFNYLTAKGLSHRRLGIPSTGT